MIGFWFVGYAHHHWHRRAVDIGIKQPNAQALLRQRNRQIDAERLFANAALTAGHGQNVCNPGQDDFSGGGFSRFFFAG